MATKIEIDMSDYPKFSFDKSRIPPLPPETAERVKEYERRYFHYVSLPDPYAPSISFEKFMEIIKDRRLMVIDEPTHIRPRLKPPINPKRESPWVKAFEEWLKANENGADE